MYLALVGCSIFKNEIDFLKSGTTSRLDFYWLPQRLHNKPLELRKLIQEELRTIDQSGKPYDAIALLYGLCSKGTVGIYSEKYPLVVPRVQDCIALLLGSNGQYRDHFREKPGTYWFTKGWIETGFSPGKKTKYKGVYDPYKEKYKEYRKKFDRDISHYLINEWDQRWIQNYTTLAFIDWGIEGAKEFKKKARENARNLGLEFEDIKGDPSLLLNLLNGKWDDNFLRIEAGQKLVPTYTDEIITCSGEPYHEVQPIRELEGVDGTVSPRMKSRSGFGLGIDAGGTYTDAVLYDFSDDQVIAWAKAVTTHDNYTIGIEHSLEKLFGQVSGNVVEKIGLVSLSTTLATNAIVEGKGGRAGIILIGYDRYTLQNIHLDPHRVIKGKHSIDGELIEPLEREEAQRAIRELSDQGIDAFALSSEVGVRNPEYEIEVKELILKGTDLPVVCGSELTDELNCVKRANTCFYNARLIPLVSDLLSSVKGVLTGKGIEAPIMVVKGDGTLMSEEVARIRPIEMVLSGPAASVIGGAYLSKVENGYVVDMGGTTTDIAVVKDGFVAFKEEGITIEGFRTAVKTVDVHTFGLGGDSYIKYHYKGGNISIGPERVIPISYLAAQFPSVLNSLRERGSSMRGEEILVQPADYFAFQKPLRGDGFHPQEVEILNVLEERGPMSRTQLAQRVGASSVSLIRTERLASYGNILRSALTPTDMLHASGTVSFWSDEAAKQALSLYAERADCSEQEFIETCLSEFYRHLIFQLFTFLFKGEKSITDEITLSHNLARHLFSSKEIFNIGIKLHNPIVFIGAPASAYAEKIAEFFELEVFVPQFNAVANAVGAITGAIRESVTILIRPEEGRGFTAFTTREKQYFKSLGDAKRKMTQLAKELVSEKALRAGARNLNVHVKVEDKKVKLSENDEVYLETLITASVSSVPVMKH
jgi:N-methylhydantoinase A/oxoprolinase/acetone carboxylase beta subunit